MTTFAELDVSWPNLLYILSQPGFEPTVFALEMTAKGYPYDFLPKRVFKDALSYLVQHQRHDDICMYFPYFGGIPMYPPYYKTSVSALAAGLGRLVLDTPYFDKWLVRWRVLDDAGFEALADASLRRWTHSGSLNYEAEYGFKSARNRRQGVVWRRIRPLADGIIEKTKRLTGA